MIKIWLPRAALPIILLKFQQSLLLRYAVFCETKYANLHEGSNKTVAKELVQKFQSLIAARPYENQHTISREARPRRSRETPARSMSNSKSVLPHICIDDGKTRSGLAQGQREREFRLFAVAKTMKSVSQS